MLTIPASKSGLADYLEFVILYSRVAKLQDTKIPYLFLSFHTHTHSCPSSLIQLLQQIFSTLLNNVYTHTISMPPKRSTGERPPSPPLLNPPSAEFLGSLAVAVTRAKRNLPKLA